MAPLATAAPAGRELGSTASVPSTATKLAALTPNTQVGPAAASRKPAKAGPTKRATWSERLLIATALSRSRLGTVDASIAWNGGEVRVPRIPPPPAGTPKNPHGSRP